MNAKVLVPIIIGAVLCLAGLWGGAYALHLFGNDWRAFPSFMTAFAAVGLGRVADRLWLRDPYNRRVTELAQ